MNYEKTGKEVLVLVGGNQNVESLTYCATRLRFSLKDENKVDFAKLKTVDGVIGAFSQSGMVQVVIGPEVELVYRQVAQRLDSVSDGNTNQQPGEVTAKNKKKKLDIVMDFISGVFTPIIPVLIGAGMIKAVLTLLTLVGWVSNKSSSFIILNFVGDAGFYFLPIFVAVSTASKLKTNMYLAAFVGAMLLHPTFTTLRLATTPVDLFGLPVPLVNYGSSVMPAILAVLFMSFVDKFFANRIHTSVKYFVHPLLVIAITAVVTLVVLGPLGAYIGQLLADLAGFLHNKYPWLVSTFIGAFNPLLVLTGMQWSITAILFQSYSAYGYEGILGPGSFVSNISQGAAALAVSMRTKNKKLKQISSSAGVTALMGITEPAMYGVTMKLKRPLIAVMIGGATGGFYAGIMGVVRYTQATPGLASFPIFIGDNPMNIVHALISVLIGFVVTFILTLVLGFEDPEVEKESETAASKNENGILETQN